MRSKFDVETLLVTIRIMIDYGTVPMCDMQPPHSPMPRKIRSVRVADGSAPGRNGRASIQDPYAMLAHSSFKP
jgi:hypothetical protein